MSGELKSALMKLLHLITVIYSEHLVCVFVLGVITEYFYDSYIVLENL